MKKNHPPAPIDMLDADLVEALVDGQDAEAVPSGVAARIKHRLLERIAQAESGHLTVHTSTDSWQAFSAGIEIKVLHEDQGVMSYLLRLAPGAVIAPHRHHMSEECVVLEGALQIGDTLTLTAGGFHLARPDSLHAAIRSVGGATIFLRGEVPTPASLV